MNMLSIIIGYISTLVTFVILDAFWFLLLAGKTYKYEIGNLLKNTVSVLPTSVFYILYTAIIFYLVFFAIEAKTLKSVIFHGGLLGLLSYGTYNMVNIVFIEGWTYKVLAMDTIWGIVVTALISVAAYIALKIAV